MRKKLFMLMILSANLLSSCKLIKVKYDFTNVDESYNFTIHFSKRENERKFTNITIKDDVKLANEKEELIKMMNDVTSCRYGYYNPYDVLIGCDYSNYGISFQKDDKVISFSYDTRDITSINDKMTGKYITFRNSQYNYSAIENLKNKIDYLITSVDDSLKEIEVNDYSSKNN